MRHLSLVAICAITLISCCNTKTIAEASTKPAVFDNSILIDDSVTVSEEKSIDNEQTISTTQVVPVPESPEAEVPEVVEKLNHTEVVEEIENETDENDGIHLVSKETSKIHDSWNALLQQHVSAKGNVDYAGFKRNSSKLRAYIATLGEQIPEDDWSQEEKLSYWMNAYNAMTVDLILRNQPLESIKDIKNPWDQRYWKLEEKYYNLDEIEHQILRKMGDARIHFGINCASFSCPPLLNEAFMPATVDAQLDKVASTFINDTSRNMISENSIEISKIFNWFSKDFKQNGSLIDYLNKYSNVKISEDAKVRYMDYDWALNK